MVLFTRLFSLVLSFIGQRYANAVRFGLLLLAVSVMHACGFHLRGALEISQDIAPVYIQQNSAFELVREIKSLLSANRISITDSQRKANSQLALLNEAKTSRVLSVDSSGRAREYLLTYVVDFSIKIKQAKESSESVTLKRSLLFDPDAVIAVANESEILYKDMRRDAARMILLKLQARSLNKDKQDAGKQSAISIEPGSVEPGVVKF